MIAAKSLALYKNRPVIVVEARDKLDIRLEDGSIVKVREKDIVLVHSGPITSIPAPASGGDFETARKMLAVEEGAEAAALTFAEAAELVFGSSGPAEALACWKEGLEGLKFKSSPLGIIPLSDAETARELEKRQRKEGEAAERAAFVERAKKARARKPSTETNQADQQPEAHIFEAGDDRFLAEIEALARGKSQKCRLATEIGFQESPEGAHAYLIRTGRWTEMVNPYSARSGCSLFAPRIALDPYSKFPERVDLRHMESWAIDNEWSHDPDDAIAWDGEAVWIHVADPASFIRPDCPADIEALSRGSTLYLPELTSPMLPDEALVRCGLGLAAESPALSFRVLVDPEGAIAKVEIFASLVRVRRSHYAQANAILAAGDSEAKNLEALALVAELRGKRRSEQGAIDIDIPEVRPHIKDGDIRIDPVPATRSSGIVRELMLLAGEAAARWAFDRGLAFPFYGQEAPGDAASLPEGLAGEFAKRRLMRAGLSGPTPSAHRGLGLPFYAQATSPLRRYQDLLGHMQIRALLEGREALDVDEVGRRCAMAQAASAATRQAERSSDVHWALAYLIRHPDWSGEGIVVGGGGSGVSTLYIPSLGLETRMKFGREIALNEKLWLKAARVDLAKLESAFEEMTRS